MPFSAEKLVETSISLQLYVMSSETTIFSFVRLPVQTGPPTVKKQIVSTHVPAQRLIFCGFSITISIGNTSLKIKTTTRMTSASEPLDKWAKNNPTDLHFRGVVRTTGQHGARLGGVGHARLKIA